MAKDKKQSTPFNSLPTLDVPGVGLIGHELAILNFIGSRVEKMRGETEAEFAVSQQLMQEAEDIYVALRNVMSRGAARKDGEEALAAQKVFWESADATKHNKEQGIGVFLQLLEDFYKAHGGNGKFTKAGCSVGECKLFSSLHCVYMLKPAVFDNYPGLKEFYSRFAAEPATKDFLNTGGKYGPGILTQYFVW